MVRHVVAGALAIAVLACYSGLSSLEPFPCASDGTCPKGFFCTGDPGSPQCKSTCDAPTTSCDGKTCTDTSTDTNNCGSCGEICGTSCSGGSCVNACTLITNKGCSSGDVCAVVYSANATLWGTACRKVGSATLGASCSAGADCDSGLECLYVNNVGKCYALCDAGHPCPSGDSCVGNANIPNGGGYCNQICGAANFTVKCTGPSGSYTCPSGAMCTATAQAPTGCTCSSGNAYTCSGTACNGTCTYPNWWCGQ